MKLDIFYGESVSGYRVVSDEDNNTKIIEMAPFQHRICFSNEFAPGWRKVGGCGTWFMGCCWVNGLENLTQKQLQNILKNASKALGEFVYGTTVENTIKSIKAKMDKLVSYIVSNSIILLENVNWKWNNINGFKQRVQTMLDGEAEHMASN